MADWLNAEILHEQLFFEDGSNIGWGNDKDGLGVGAKIVEKGDNGYIKRDGGYDDCVMRKAMMQVSPTHYQLLWFGRRMKCNCQDYADMLRQKYGELIKDKKVRCECGIK